MNINLCFHGIGVCNREREPGEARYWVAEDTFLRILDLVRSQRRVQLSFDDGNLSDIEVGLPALAARGLRATFFPLAGRLADPASLNPADLEHLRRSGMEIGSHGWSHIPWRGLSAQQARQEYVEAQAALAAASNGPIDEVALPLGRYDRSVLRELRSNGYRRVYTSDRFPARPTSWLQARYSVTAADTVESVARLVTHRQLVHEARNYAASVVKRAL